MSDRKLNPNTDPQIRTAEAMERVADKLDAFTRGLAENGKRVAAQVEAGKAKALEFHALRATLQKKDATAPVVAPGAAPGELSPPNPLVALAKRIEALEARFAALEAHVGVRVVKGRVLK